MIHFADGQTEAVSLKQDQNLAQRIYRHALAVPDHPDRDKLLTALRMQRLEPLLPHLKGIRHLLVVPTGDMAKVPLEALSDKFTISYIPSGTVHARLAAQHRALQASSLLALGDPIFEFQHPNAGRVLRQAAVCRELLRF